MPILWRSTLRWPLRRPWQALLAVIGVAMGVAVVIAIDIANDSARRAFVASTQTLSGQATHQIVGGTAGIPEDFFRRLRVDVGVAASAPVVEGYVQTNGATPRTLTVLGIDIFSELAFRPQMTASGTPLGNGMAALLTVPDSVVLSQRTAATLGVAAGDQFTVQIASRTRQLTVVAVLGEGGGSEAVLLDDLLLTDIATAQEWYGKVGVLDRIDLMLADDAAQRAVAALLPPGLHLTTPAQRAQSITQMTESFEINLNALSLLALVVGMFLIYNTMTFSVVQRRQLLGTLRCLGVGIHGRADECCNAAIIRASVQKMTLLQARPPVPGGHDQAAGSSALLMALTAPSPPFTKLGTGLTARTYHPEMVFRQS